MWEYPALVLGCTARDTKPIHNQAMSRPERSGREPGEKSLAGAFVAPAFLFVSAWAVIRGPQPPDRPLSTPNLGLLELPSDVYDPVRAGEDLPDGFRQLLVRDGILPIYDPRFRTAADTDWAPETLVLAIEVDGAAKAYPVGHLNSREMVIDSLAGIPILVTW